MEKEGLRVGEGWGGDRAVVPAFESLTCGMKHAVRASWCSGPEK